MPVNPTTAFDQAEACFQFVRSLLNDADIPSNIPIIATAGAVRSGNLVTITTSAAHGLQQGMFVQVASVSDTSFNGSFQVVGVPTSTTFTYNQTGSNASSGNGVVSILIQGDWATDAVLIPFANAAQRKVQRRLMENGSKTSTNEVIFTNVPANTVQISDSTTPQLPPDFLAPRELYERITGQGPGNIGFVPMKSVDVIPNVPQAGYNGVFAWWFDTLNFLGANQATDIRMRYFTNGASLAISDGSSALASRGIIDPVAYWTAFLAATSRGSTNAGIFGEQFEEAMKELLNVQAHARQYQPARRRPFRGGRSRYGYGWGTGGTI